jgi:RNA polymerase sigma factor (sigma-70 family)
MNAEARIGDRRGMAVGTGFAEKTNPNRPVPPASGSCREMRGEARPFPERCDPANPRRPLTAEQRELATQYMPLARALARQADGPSVDLDELEAEAYAALVDAARSFDPARGVNFAVHARLRIRGALRDYRRFLFHAGWKGEASESPAFQRLSVTDDAPHGQFIGKQAEEPLGHTAELHEAVESVIRRLPRPHARACRLIYIDGRSADETAAVLGCSKGHLSHLHSQAIVRLRRDHREALAG